MSGQVRQDRVLIGEQSVRATVASIFEKMGVSRQHAETGADVLVSTDLRGVESHGVSIRVPAYVEQYRAGILNPTPEWRIVRELRSVATIDGDGGLGVTLAPTAMRIAMEKARDVGFGVVALYNAGHSGASGHNAMIAAKEDMVGMCATCSGTRVLPTFGAEPRLGTNPISVAAPARHEPPFLLDMATSAIAGGRIGVTAGETLTVSPGWVADADGVPVTDERNFASDANEGVDFQLLPLGGTSEGGSHKGYGLALMVETLTSLLSGGLPSMLDPSPMRKHFFAAYDVSAFTDLDAFKDAMDRTLLELRRTKPAPGLGRVVYPGLIEYEEEQRRRTSGIPLRQGVVQWFDEICKELEVPALSLL